MRVAIASVVTECLNVLVVDCTVLEAADDGNDGQFKAIRKGYHATALKKHPDKGGSKEEMQEVLRAWVKVKEIFESGINNFLAVLRAETTSMDSAKADISGESAFAGMGEVPIPTWEYFFNADEKEMPLYRMEKAKSGRSTCQGTQKARKCETNPDNKKKGDFIELGALRVGMMDRESGTYSRWAHLDCWSVPTKVQDGLPHDLENATDEEVRNALLTMDHSIFIGFSELDTKAQDDVIAYVRDRESWAKRYKKKGTPAAAEAADLVESEVKPSVSAATDAMTSSSSSSAVGKARTHFQMPKPGVNGAQHGALAGKTVVMTGVFPEVGGGAGLSLGKEKVKAMITAFGGRVTSALSGKTDMLIVGKEPGGSKLMKARSMPKVQLISLLHTKQALEGEGFELQPQPVIGELSSGYNGRKVILDAEQETVAKGTEAYRLGIEPPSSKPKAKPKAKAKPKPKPKGKAKGKAKGKGTTATKAQGNRSGKSRSVTRASKEKLAE